MKKLLIACSMIGAVALVACAATDNSVKPTYAEESWFGAKVEGDEIVGDRGAFSARGESTVEVSGDKIEIDSELSDPVSFVLDENTAEPLTTKFARVTFELDPAVVPYSARPTADDLANVKVAFALCENMAGTDTNFCAWVASEWKNLNFTIPADTYELTMNFDESDSTANKVQFSIGEETSGWFTYTPALYNQKPQIDFVGSGKIKTLAAAQRKLVEAEIEITGGSVTIAGDDMGAMNALKTGTETIEDVLNAQVQSKFGPGIDATLTVAEAYAIGMITNNAGTMVAKGNDAFNVKADATATTTDGIKVRFVTPLTPNDPNATITYGLKGSKNGTGWDVFTDVTANNPDAIKIPTDKVTAGYRYFKVVTKVALKPTNAQ